MKHLISLLLIISTLLAHKQEEAFRLFDETAPERVKEFYRTNHTNQTLEFVLEKKREFLPLTRAKMSIWEAFELLDTIIDQSDPDIDLPQSYHAFQTAEAIRKDGHPRWLIVTGLIDDLGKVLETFGEPSWAVVGDTFPVGCAFSDQIVFAPYFRENPDQFDRLGIYEGGVRARSSPHVLGARRVSLPRSERQPPSRSALYDPLPLILRDAPRRGVRVFTEC